MVREPVRRVHRQVLRLFRLVPAPGRRAIVRRTTPSWAAGAMCVVVDGEGRVLLVRNSYRPAWGCPGGMLKRGEQPVDAAVREAREETGLAIVVDGHPIALAYPRVRRLDLVCRCRPAAGADPAAVRSTSAEITEAAWFAVDALPDLQKETAAALRAAGVPVRRTTRSRS